MDWHEYLREERAQKLVGLKRLEASQLLIVEDRGGERVDATAIAIARLRLNISQIEEILTAAGQPYEP